MTVELISRELGLAGEPAVFGGLTREGLMVPRGLITFFLN